MIIFQTPLNYWGKSALFYSNKKVSVNPSSNNCLPWLYYFIKNMILSLTDEKNSTKEIWGKIKLSAKAKAGIQWWINNIDNSCHHINISLIWYYYIYWWKSSRWGITDGISPSRGLWHKAMLEQINFLGLKAIKIGIYTYCKRFLTCQRYGMAVLQLSVI